MEGQRGGAPIPCHLLPPSAAFCHLLPPSADCCRPRSLQLPDKPTPRVLTLARRRGYDLSNLCRPPATPCARLGRGHELKCTLRDKSRAPAHTWHTPNALDHLHGMAPT